MAPAHLVPGNPAYIGRHIVRRGTHTRGSASAVNSQAAAGLPAVGSRNGTPGAPSPTVSPARGAPQVLGSATAAANAIASASPARPGSGTMDSKVGVIGKVPPVPPPSGGQVGPGFSSIAPPTMTAAVAVTPKGAASNPGTISPMPGTVVQQQTLSQPPRQAQVAQPPAGAARCVLTQAPLAAAAPRLVVKRYLTITVKGVPGKVATAALAAAAATNSAWREEQKEKAANSSFAAPTAGTPLPVPAALPVVLPAVTVPQVAVTASAPAIGQPVVGQPVVVGQPLVVDQAVGVQQIQVNSAGVATDPLTEQGSVSGSGGVSVLTPQFSFHDNDHVTIWNRLERRKIAGNAAPLGRNVCRYLDQHPDCEVYYNQDKADTGTLSGKKRSRMEAEQALAGDHVPIWNKVEKRKIAGNAAPLAKNLAKYLSTRPNCEKFTNQDQGSVPMTDGVAVVGDVETAPDRSMAITVAPDIDMNVAGKEPVLDLDSEPCLTLDMALQDASASLKTCPLTGDLLNPPPLDAPRVESVEAANANAHSVAEWVVSSDIDLPNMMESAAAEFLKDSAAAAAEFLSMPGDEDTKVPFLSMSGLEDSTGLDLEHDDIDLGIDVDVMAGNFEAVKDFIL